MATSTVFTDYVKAQYRMSRGVFIAVGINVVVFVTVRLSLLAGPGLLQLLELSGRPEELVHRPWTIVTFAFVQIDFLHLLVNMVLLFFFGRRLGRLSTDRNFWLIYLVGALAGSILFTSIANNASQQLVGSSASVMAMAVAASVANPRHRVFIFPGFHVNMALLTAVILAIDVLTMAAGDSVSHVAHIGGAASGALVAALLIMRQKRMRPVRTKHQNKTSDFDVILRKLQTSGHDSLTDAEKRRLFNLSGRKKN